MTALGDQVALPASAADKGTPLCMALEPGDDAMMSAPVAFGPWRLLGSFGQGHTLSCLPLKKLSQQSDVEVRDKSWKEPHSSFDVCGNS